MSTQAIGVVSKSITVQAPAARAFAVFTEGIAGWWPLRTHSVGEENAETVTFEGFEGGRLFETSTGGSESEWGRVVAWEPPDRIVYSWYAGRTPGEATEVEIRFVAEGDDTTRVELEHRGWENRGEEAEAARASYDEGWDPVLAAYVEAADQGRADT